MSKILIVEDDKKIALSLSVRLRAEGHTPVVAHDAIMAISVALRERPDLAILDISMPGGNGFQVADRIQSNVHLTGIPMVFITASRHQGIRERAEEAGASAFFEKPYDIVALLDCIRELLGIAPLPTAQD